MLRQDQRSTQHRGFIVLMVVVLIICVIVSVCGGIISSIKSSIKSITTQTLAFDQTKLNAEEAGYNRELGVIILASEERAATIYARLRDCKKHQGLGEKIDSENEIKIAKILSQGFEEEAKINLAKLERLLPPPSMFRMHFYLINIYKISKNKDVSLMESDCAGFVNAARTIRGDLLNRTVVGQTQAPVNIVFHPRSLPVSMSVNTGNGDVSFAAELSISTPVGDFSLSQANSAGVKKMVIRSNGKERIFDLENKPFKVFVPSRYGVEISSDGDVLTVDVRSK